MPSLAVKYRPKDFSDVVSQKSTVNILNRQLVLKQFKNSYLFSGSSGCGKTTIARIFANKINNGCGCPIEIDAASNNGVDNIKSLIKSAQERSLDSEYKVIILDECHALTGASWQALLKCIEEPPKYTIFIFCTTDVQKVPSTILNRCQRFNFTRIPVDLIKHRLTEISMYENFTNFEESVDYIARICKGQMRDAISHLEKVASYSTEFNISQTISILGNFSYDIFFSLINSMIDMNEGEILAVIDKIYTDGNDLKVFVDQYLTFCVDLMKYSVLHSMDILQIPVSMKEALDYTTSIENAPKYFQYVINKLLDLKNMLKTDSNPRNTIDVMFLQICR